MATNAEVAERIGVSHSTVSRMRSGTRVASTAVLQRISQEYDIPLSDLVDAAVNARKGKKGAWKMLMKRVMSEEVPVG